MRRFVPLCFSLSILSLLTSCTLYARPQGPMVWIDAPLDGLAIPAGQTLTLEGHAASSTGIDYIEVWVDSELQATIPSPDQVGTLSRFSQPWTPPGPGTYSIQMVAYDQGGSASPPDTITLRVGSDEDEATPVATPTSTPESTEIPASITPSATPSPTPFIPTPTFTWIPPTDPPTEPPTPDTSGPNPPSPNSPVGGGVLGCSGTVTLNWSAASDPSGIGGYSVELQRHSGDNNWSSASGSPFSGISGTSTGVPVECGWYYRWRVRARDGASNWGSYSSWAEFTVNLG